MPDNAQVKLNYTHGNLLAEIIAGVTSLGKTPQTVTLKELAAVDEFHIGGNRASADFLDQLGLSPDAHLLDIGCGLGGTSRFVADRYKCRVTGVDLTAEYVETGNVLCQWVGLGNRVALSQGNALALSFDDNTFDGAFMMHVGMNIADKTALFSEVCRVLRPGALFGIFDVMRIGEGELTFPFPWATSPDSSAVETPEHYTLSLQKAGFSVETMRNRHKFAVAFFEQLRTRVKSSLERPPLGIHVLLGKTAAMRVKSMVANIAAGKIAPVELIARKN